MKRIFVDEEKMLEQKCKSDSKVDPQMDLPDIQDVGIPDVAISDAGTPNIAISDVGTPDIQDAGIQMSPTQISPPQMSAPQISKMPASRCRPHRCRHLRCKQQDVSNKMEATRWSQQD